MNFWKLLTVSILIIFFDCAPRGEDCKLNERKICKEGVTYWVDSCGNQGDKVEDCSCGLTCPPRIGPEFVLGIASSGLGRSRQDGKQKKAIYT
jgi:hypothetical protein